MPLNNTAIRDTAVYRQDAEPTDTREGVIWVDTSGTGSPETKIYGDGSWGPLANVPLFVLQEAVTFQETDANLTLQDTVVYNGSVVIGGHLSEQSTANWADGDDGTYTDLATLNADGGNKEWHTLASGLAAPGGTIHRIWGSYAESGDRGPDYHRTRLTESDGTQHVIDHADANRDSGLSSSTLTTFDLSGFGEVAVGDIDQIEMEVSNPSTLSSTTFRVHELDMATLNNDGVSGTAYVGFDSIPADMAAWDRLSWQYDEGAGSVTFDVEIDDGTGWSTHRTDVLPPVGIAGLSPDTDVRLVANLSRPTSDDTSPAIPYVARRGER